MHLWYYPGSGGFSLMFGFTLAVTQTMSRHKHRTQKTFGPRVLWYRHFSNLRDLSPIHLPEYNRPSTAAMTTKNYFFPQRMTFIYSNTVISLIQPPSFLVQPFNWQIFYDSFVDAEVFHVLGLTRNARVNSWQMEIFQQFQPTVGSYSFHRMKMKQLSPKRWFMAFLIHQHLIRCEKVSEVSAYSWLLYVELAAPYSQGISQKRTQLNSSLALMSDPIFKI